MFKINPFNLAALTASSAAMQPCRAEHPDFGATHSTLGEPMKPIRCGARSVLHRGKHRARLASGIVLRWEDAK
jgi:hypothetical protein